MPEDEVLHHVKTKPTPIRACFFARVQGTHEFPKIVELLDLPCT